MSYAARLRKLETALASRVAFGDPAADARSRSGLRGYLDSISIDSSPDPRKLADVIEPWQRLLYDAATPIFERAAGYDVPPGPRCLMATLPKGHSKTSTVAQLINWALTYSKRPLTIVAAAADRDQAGILAQRCEREAGCNPWLSNRLKRSYYRVVGQRGQLDVLSSDAPTSSGLLPDIIVCDEITFWRRRDLFDMLFAARRKRPGCAFIVLTNAGLTATWQHDLWMAAKADTKNWVTYETPGSVASWLDPEALAADRKLLPPAIAQRLFDNVWTSDSGEYVTRQQVEACIDFAWREQATGTGNNEYVLSLDYGAVKDRATAAVMHLDTATDRVVLDRMHIHQGTHACRTPIELVQQWAVGACKDFQIREMIADPYQLEVVCQAIEARGGIVVNRFVFSSPANHHRLADNLRTLVINRKLKLYPHAGQLILPNGASEDLVDEMAALIVEQGIGDRYRFNHVSGKHDDRATSLALAALACVQRRRPQAPVISVVSADPSAPFTPLDDPTTYDPFGGKAPPLYSPW